MFYVKLSQLTANFFNTFREIRVNRVTLTLRRRHDIVYIPLDAESLAEFICKTKAKTRCAKSLLFRYRRLHFDIGRVIDRETLESANLMS